VKLQPPSVLDVSAEYDGNEESKRVFDSSGFGKLMSVQQIIPFAESELLSKYDKHYVSDY